MTARDQNFTMYAGDTVDIIVPIDADLTGASVKWAMMKSIEGEHTISRSSPAGITIDAEKSSFTIRLEREDTLELSGAFYHEAELTDALGNASTTTVGTIVIKLSGV